MNLCLVQRGKDRGVNGCWWRHLFSCSLAVSLARLPVFALFIFMSGRTLSVLLIFILPPFSSNLYPFSVLIPFTGPLEVSLTRVRKDIRIWSHKFSKASVLRCILYTLEQLYSFLKKHVVTYLL